MNGGRLSSARGGSSTAPCGRRGDKEASVKKWHRLSAVCRRWKLTLLVDLRLRADGNERVEGIPLCQIAVLSSFHVALPAPTKVAVSLTVLPTHAASSPPQQLLHRRIITFVWKCKLLISDGRASVRGRSAR